MGVNYQKCPFPWFGGKSQAAEIVWSLIGDVPHYVEPFYGSGAVLLNRPHPCNRPYYSETVNDLDGFLVNFWRAVQFQPELTAQHASWPVSEYDKSARQIAVLKWRTEKHWELLAGSADFCDPRIAGWWAWATCCQIGAFDFRGSWTADPKTGRIVKAKKGDGGVRRNLPHLGDDGRGVNRPQLREPGVARNLPHLGDDGQGVNRPQLREPGVARDLPHIADDGQGVNRPQLREPGVARDLPHIADNGKGVNHAGAREPGVSALDELGQPEFHPIAMPELIRWFQWLSARLRHVRIVNGSWDRVCTKGAAWTLPVRQGKGPCGVFLDPPYSAEADRSNTLYAEESTTVAHDVREWCKENGDDPKFRIVLAGYDVEHEELERHGWQVHEWFTQGFLSGGMGNTSKQGDDESPKHQQHRERMWSSPHCLSPANADLQMALFV